MMEAIDSFVKGCMEEVKKSKSLWSILFEHIGVLAHIPDPALVHETQSTATEAEMRARADIDAMLTQKLGIIQARPRQFHTHSISHHHPISSVSDDSHLWVWG